MREEQSNPTSHQSTTRILLRQLLTDQNPPDKHLIVAARVGSSLYDLQDEIDHDASVEWVRIGDPEGLEILRHSAAHLMAAALATLFEGVQFAIGPVKGETFFYDVSLPDGQRMSDKHFGALHLAMQKLVKSDQPFVKEKVSRREALQLFHHQKYKLEIIQEIPESEEITIYRLGNWYDLCRGPHVPSTRYLKWTHLLSVSGAYWKNSSEQAQLDRILGTAWPTEEGLKQYLHFLEDLKKRDHVRLGKEMQLFEVHSDISPGSPFFYGRGMFLKKMLTEYARSLMPLSEYEEVETPQIFKFVLWETSGHAQHFKDDMFVIQEPDVKDFSSMRALKPMSCPGHIRVFQRQPRSYRDLPLRICEFGVVHRNELTGALHGLTRVVRFTQDDAHIFCTKEQILTEIQELLGKIKKISRDFGFHEVEYKLSTRPENHLGSPEIWDEAESILESALQSSQLPYRINPGDGAFYGPKIDFYFKDSAQRWHQCSTIQLDFVLAERFQAAYTTSQNEKVYPIVIHRALFGSLERFMALYIESVMGHLNPALHLEQVRILPIGHNHLDYAQDVMRTLRNASIRAWVDTHQDPLSAKLKRALSLRVPYIVIVGDQEVQESTVTVRHYGDQYQCSVSELIIRIQDACGAFWDLSRRQTNIF